MQILINDEEPSIVIKLHIIEVLMDQEWALFEHLDDRMFKCVDDIYDNKHISIEFMLKSLPSDCECVYDIKKISIILTPEESSTCIDDTTVNIKHAIIILKSLLTSWFRYHTAANAVSKAVDHNELINAIANVVNKYDLTQHIQLWKKLPHDTELIERPTIFEICLSYGDMIRKDRRDFIWCICAAMFGHDEYIETKHWESFCNFIDEIAPSIRVGKYTLMMVGD